MESKTIKFTRSRSDGLIANVWWTEPPDAAGKRKLRFTNDKSTAEMPLGVPIRLVWELTGVSGAQLKIDRKIVGVDDEFVPLLKSSTIPPDGEPVAGGQLHFRDTMIFTLSEDAP